MRLLKLKINNLMKKPKLLRSEIFLQGKRVAILRGHIYIYGKLTGKLQFDFETILIKKISLC